MNYPPLRVRLSYAIILVTTISYCQRKAEIANKYFCIKSLISGLSKNDKHESCTEKAEQNKNRTMELVVSSPFSRMIAAIENMDNNVGKKDR